MRGCSKSRSLDLSPWAHTQWRYPVARVAAMIAVADTVPGYLIRITNSKVDESRTCYSLFIQRRQWLLVRRVDLWTAILLPIALVRSDSCALLVRM